MLNLTHNRFSFIELITFFAFCLSTVFMIFLSTRAVQVWPNPWNRVSILSACLIPALMVLIWNPLNWFNWPSFKKNLLFPSIIVIMGALNIVLSEDRSISLKVMTLFLISGISVFVVSSKILNNHLRQDIFLWLCWACFIFLCVHGIVEFITHKNILLLSYNPIPAGSLLILLSAGPLLIFCSTSKTLHFYAFSSLILGFIIILLIGKRGTVLGLLGMAFFLGFTLPRKRGCLIILIALTLFGIGYLTRDHLSAQLTKHYFKDQNTLIRAENYFFAGSIWLKKPIFGIGLHAPLTRHLEFYRPKIYTRQKPQDYSYYINKAKTFENIILCGFVEMGTLLTITYIMLIALLLINMFKHVRHNPHKRMRAVLLLTPLFGFFIHSMTFDSIIYPHLNWIAHTYLGLMYNFSEI